MEDFNMAKAAKKAKSEIDNTPDILPDVPDVDSDNAVTGAFDPADDGDPHYNIENDSADADIDYQPDYPPEGDDGDEADTDDSSGDEIESPPDDDSPRLEFSKETIKKAKRSGSRLKYALGYLNWGDSTHKADWILNKTVVTGMQFVAPWDLATSNRELFRNNKPLETHTHFWLDCLDHDGIPPRPKTFENKKEWEHFPGTDNKVDPWTINYTLVLVDESGSILLFQANKAPTKQAFGALMAEFEGRRPIIELTKTATNQPLFRIVGWAKRLDDFSFLKEVLIIHDDPYKPDNSIFGDEGGDED
jgi:hypothetical protein